MLPSTNALLSISKQRSRWTNQDQGSEQGSSSYNRGGYRGGKSSINQPRNSRGFKPKKFSRYQKFTNYQNAGDKNRIQTLLDGNIETLKNENQELKNKCSKIEAELNKYKKQVKMITAERNVYLNRISSLKLINRDLTVKRSGYLDENITDEQLKVELTKMGLTAGRNIELEF